MKQTTPPYAINKGHVIHFADSGSGTANSVLGVGIDIINIERVRKALSAEIGLQEQLFSEEELAFCGPTAEPAVHLAARFSAKEAFLKAIGIGLQRGTRFREIEVMMDADGNPSLKLHGRMKQLAVAQKIRTAQVSLSFGGGMAMAIVILES